MSALWIDLGNTRLKYWLTSDSPSFTTPEILLEGAVPHQQNLAQTVKNIEPYLIKADITQVRLASVLNEQITQNVIAQLAQQYVNIEQAQTGKKDLVGNNLVETLYDCSQLGIDRWLQVVAAAQHDQNTCVIGCGTAITIDFVQGLKHAGGYILPNLHLQRAALAQGTHRVQIFEGDFNNITYGHTTADAVNHGIGRLFSSLLEEICREPFNYQLLFTGGDATYLSQLTPPQNTFKVDNYLLLKGLIRTFS